MAETDDVHYRSDWQGKQALAAQAPTPATLSDSIAAVLRAVFMEVERYNEYHAYDETFVDTPIAALMLNASNRLPPALAEIVLSIGWLRSEAQQQRYQLDENLQESICQRLP